MASHNIVYLLATHHKMGIQRTDKRHSAKYFHNSNSSPTEQNSRHKMTLDSKVSCQFLYGKFKK